MQEKYRIVKINDHIGTAFCPQVKMFGLFWASWPFTPKWHTSFDDAIETIVKKREKKVNKTKEYIYLGEDLSMLDK